jgi:hypothetical protein
MAFAKKVDKNQVAVVKTLRDYGAQVFHLHTQGGGIPDLMVCYNDQTILLEVKDGADKKLTPMQITLFANWQGGPLHRVNSCEEAINVLKLYELES